MDIWHKSGYVLIFSRPDRRHLFARSINSNNEQQCRETVGPDSEATLSYSNNCLDNVNTAFKATGNTSKLGENPSWLYVTWKFSSFWIWGQRTSIARGWRSWRSPGMRRRRPPRRRRGDRHAVGVAVAGVSPLATAAVMKFKFAVLKIHQVLARSWQCLPGPR